MPISSVNREIAGDVVRDDESLRRGTVRLERRAANQTW